MLVIDDLTLRIAGRALLEDASAQVPDGARVGLIGRNGAGKSTLFRAIAGDIAPEHGAIALSGDLQGTAGIGAPQEELPLKSRVELGHSRLSSADQGVPTACKRSEAHAVIEQGSHGTDLRFLSARLVRRMSPLRQK